MKVNSSIDLYGERLFIFYFKVNTILTKKKEEKYINAPLLVIMKQSTVNLHQSYIEFPKSNRNCELKSIVTPLCLKKIK